MPLPAELQPLESFLTEVPPPALNVLLASRVGNSLVLRRLSLSQDAATLLREIPKKYLRRLRNSEVRDYQLGYSPSEHELLKMGVAAETSIQSTIQALNTVDQVPLFAGNGDALEGLAFYVFHLQNTQGRRALFLKATSPKLQLGKKFPYAAIFGDGTYDKVVQSILLFDESFDCFVWGTNLYIQKLTAFRRIFDFFAQLRERAGETVDAILTRIRISNPDDFRSACTGQLQMLAKMDSIRSKPYFATLSMERVRESMEAFSVDVAIEEDDHGEDCLVFETNPEKRWLILKLLDDDYLTSAMTDLRYEVNSKSQLS